MGQGNNKVEEDYNQGACDHRLDAANARAKEVAQRSQKRTQSTHSSFWDKPTQERALGNGGGGWRVMAVNVGVGGGGQRAMVELTKQLTFEES
jgi:hypothetical protein